MGIDEKEKNILKWFLGFNMENWQKPPNFMKILSKDRAI